MRMQRLRQIFCKDEPIVEATRSESRIQCRVMDLKVWQERVYETTDGQIDKEEV